MTNQYINVIEKDDSSGCDILSSLVPLASVFSPNLIINGDMRIAQRGTSFVDPASTDYTLDRWQWSTNGTTSAEVVITQDSDTPATYDAGLKYSSSLKIDVTTAETLSNNNAALRVRQKLESQDVHFLGFGTTGALSTTLSFWIKSTQTGTMCVQLVNNGTEPDRIYTAEVTLDSAESNNWVKKTVTFPGDIGGGDFPDNNSVGMTVHFVLAVGGDGDAATRDEWEGSTASTFSTPNQTNLLDSTANNIFLTGVKLEIGEIATPFVSRTYGEELALCQRYYVRFEGPGTGSTSNSTLGSALGRGASSAFAHIEGPVDFRASPVVAVSSHSSSDGFFLIDASNTRVGTSVESLGWNGRNGLRLSMTGFSNLVADQFYLMELNDIGWLELDAEL